MLSKENKQKTIQELVTESHSKGQKKELNLADGERSVSSSLTCETHVRNVETISHLWEVKGARALEPRLESYPKQFNLMIVSLKRRYLPLIGEDECANCINAILVVLEVYKLYGIKPKSSSKQDIYIRAVQKAIQRILDYCSAQGPGSWIQYMKYKISAKFAFDHGQPIPEAPKGLDICDKPGWIIKGVYARREKFLSKPQRESLSYSILMSKKGMPRAGKTLIKAAECKTLEKLTTRPGPLPPLSLVESATGWFALDQITMEAQLTRTVEELFGETQFTIEDLTEPHFPSTSSNYNRTRSGLGAVGAIYDEFLEGTLREELLEFKYGTFEVNHEVTRVCGPLGREEQQLLDNAFNENPDDYVTMIGCHVNVKRFEARWRKLYWQIYKRGLTEIPYVEPLGLAEALKIRVISKGPPFLYTALKPLQKFMWKTLKSHKTFQLIGEPVTEEIITQCLGRCDPRKDVIVSGDYKSSTDNLHNWVTECIARKLASILRRNGFFPESLEEMLIRSLTRHIFVAKDECCHDICDACNARDEQSGDRKSPCTHNKDKHVLGVCAFPQREGQLMGSITSFPVLCIANAAMCRWALEESNKTTYLVVDSPKGIPLRVNGDDCVLKGNRFFLPQVWERITAFGGLETSVGKTYYSNRFAVINSVLYDYYPDKLVLKTSDSLSLNFGLVFEKSRYRWVERKYVNLGLLYGYKRSQSEKDQESDEQTVDVFQLGVLQQELKRTCPDELWDVVAKNFVKKHFEKLTDRKYRNIPWYVPSWAGGMGFAHHNQKVYSLQERRAITWIKIHWSDLDLRPKNIPHDSVWKMHNLVLNRISDEDVLFDCGYLRGRYIGHGLSMDLNETFRKVYKYATIETLFSHERDDLYAEAGDCFEGYQAFNSAVKWNRDLWSVLMESDLHQYDPALDEEITTQQVGESFPILCNIQ